MLTIRCLNEKKADVWYTLLVGKTYTVGRKGGDISFPDDQSVSRNHAEISVEHPMANVSDPLLIPTVVLTDLGSKFGTFANEGIDNMSPISMREPMNLSPGDKFRFGRQWNVFQINYTPLVITSSTIKDLAKLKKVIMTLGGHMVNEWHVKCDYIVMESLTLTVKAVCAILSGKHVVVPSYFDDLYECVLTKKRKPDPKRFLPPLGEKSLEADGLSFDPEPARNKVFEGKTFLFASQKHLNKIGVAVKCGGGKCDLISNVMSTRPANLKNPDFIILNPGVEPAMLDSRIREGIDIYKRAKKRLVSDAELGLAAVYISTEKHCNPCIAMTDRNIPQKLGSQTQSTQSSSSSSVPLIVSDTQTSTTSTSQASKSSVPGPPLAEPNAKSKRVKVEPDEDDDVIFSEEVPSGSSAATSKRSHNGKTSDASSSKKRPAQEISPGEADSRASSNASKRIRTVREEDSEQSQKALSNIFAMFSDDDDDDHAELLVSRVPDTPPSYEINESVKIVTPSLRPAAASPDLFDISGSDSEETSSVAEIMSPCQDDTGVRSTRSRSKVASPEKRPSTQNHASTSAREVSLAGSSKRKLRSPEEAPSKSNKLTPVQNAKKRKVNDATNVINLSDSLEVRTGALSITSTEVKKEDHDKKAEEGLENIEIPVIVAPLLKKTTLRPSLIENAEGRSVKNFKRFNKVLPHSGSRDVSIASEVHNGVIQIPSFTEKLTYLPYVDPDEVKYVNRDVDDFDADEDEMNVLNEPGPSRNPFRSDSPNESEDNEIEQPPVRKTRTRVAPVVKERSSTTESTRTSTRTRLPFSDAVIDENVWDF